ncbi:MAG: hypothetical protein N3A01_06365 [Bacteroidales bacterium]|nr:hypothetical protein [Bacteroidales bacterium]
MKNLSKTKELLFSENTENILTAINRIIENNYIELIPYLFEVYINKKDEKIKKKIYFILSTLKQNASVDYVIEGIKRVKVLDKYPELIRICWENGLDYSKHLRFFINYFINNSIEVAIESFSVIENNLYNASFEELKYSLIELDKNKNKISEEKMMLYKELCLLLYQKLEDNSFSKY